MPCIRCPRRQTIAPHHLPALGDRMAEYVKWRLTRMRTGVTVALFGLLAGLGLRARESEPAAFERAAALTLPKGTRLPANSIGTAQVKMHSLLLSDMKEHQVASYSSSTRLSKAFHSLDTLFVKMNGQVNALSDNRAKVNDALTTFETKDAAASTFLGKDDTAVNAAKVENVGLDGLIQGHGSVLTGEVVPTQTPAPLLDVPGTLSIQASSLPGTEGTITMLNTSSQSILISDGQNSHSVSPGKTFTDTGFVDGSVRTYQVLANGDGKAVTLTLSSYGSGGDQGIVGQALVGTP